MSGGKDIVHCYDAKTGQEIWHHEYPMSVDPKLFEGGPRSTPVLDGGHLYAVSHEGDLWCLDAATGKKVWYKHYQQDFGGRRPDWGYAGSPLVNGNAVYCDMGGQGSSTVALEKATGKLLWKSGSDAAGYGTPLAATFGGKETLVVFKADAVVGYDRAERRGALAHAVEDLLRHQCRHAAGAAGRPALHFLGIQYRAARFSTWRGTS